MATTNRPCSIIDCQRPHLAKGVCRLHYLRAWRAARPRPPSRPLTSKQATFLQLRDHPEDTDECVPWPHARTKKGYAEVYIDGECLIVHRALLTARDGPPPLGRNEAAHSCGAPECVNVRHLRWASLRENQEDRRGHGTWGSVLNEDLVRSVYALKGECSITAAAVASGVSEGNVRNVWYGLSWRWVTGEPAPLSKGGG